MGQTRKVRGDQLNERIQNFAFYNSLISSRNPWDCNQSSLCVSLCLCGEYKIGGTKPGTPNRDRRFRLLLPRHFQSLPC